MNRRPSPIEAAKTRHSLAEVAVRTGIHIPAGRAGLLSVRCPMPAHGHPDRSPSLRLDLDRDMWWCFACSPTGTHGTPRAGDVIEWASQTEHVGWQTAIDILDSGRPLTNAWAAGTASRSSEWTVRAAGYSEEPDLSRTPEHRVRHALDAAWSYYSYGPLHAKGVLYLTAGRRIDINVLEAHNRRSEVGHTPTSPTGLVDRLRSMGFTTEELVDAGLAQRRVDDGRTCDFYRQRVLIPIRDAEGVMAGIVGRNVGDSRWPKYKNPPRTLAYDKSVNLYQPLAGPTGPYGRVVVVEGTIDALAIATAAVKAGCADRFCPVTQSGRELSPQQLEHVLNIHPQPPVIAMDGDGPGRDSNQRLATAAASLGRDVVIASLPNDEDPASWLLSRGGGGLRAFTAESDVDEARCRASVRLAGSYIGQRLKGGPSGSEPSAQRPDIGRVPTL